MFKNVSYRNVAFTLAAAFVMLLAAEAPAWADPFDLLMDKFASAFTGMRAVVYVLGAFSLIAFAIAGLFGKAKWQTIAIMSGGLFTLVVAAEIVTYLSSGTGNITATTNLEEDVFTQIINWLGRAFVGIRGAVYVASAFTLIGVAVAAVMGKVKWQLVAHMAAGLFLLVVAVEIINFVGTAGITEVSAGGSEDLFSGVLTKLADLFTGVRAVVYVSSAFALVAAAVGGLMGKLQWKTVAHMVGALWMLLMTEQIINYVVGEDVLTSSGTAIDLKSDGFPGMSGCFTVGGGSSVITICPEIEPAPPTGTAACNPVTGEGCSGCDVKTGLCF